MHHLVSEVHQKQACIYCKNRLNGIKWQSEFLQELHYKTALCSCGKKLRIRVSFLGSGHDDWGIDGRVNKEMEKIKTIS